MKISISNKKTVTIKNVLSSKSTYIWATNGLTYDIKINDMSIFSCGVNFKMKQYKNQTKFKNAIVRILKMQKHNGLNMITK